MKKDYTATEKKIRELVPRLMELSFGCLVENNDGKEGIKVYLGSIDDDSNIKLNEPILRYSVYKNTGNPCCFKGETKKSHSYKTIGHKITKEVVEEAVLDANSGEFNKYCEQEIIQKIIPKLTYKWQYGKDFSQQSEETKQFITDLLN